MIPTGGGKVGMKIETPDGPGKVVIVHNQDNVTVELDGKTLLNRRTGKEQPILFVGDVGECNEWCDDCDGFHTFNKHTEKEAASV